jgi:acyl carrier protein
MTSTATTICEILQEYLGCDPVAPECLSDPELLAELKADSLDMIELIMQVEERLNVSITDAEADAFLPNAIGTTRALSELCAMIDAKLAAKREGVGV